MSEDLDNEIEAISAIYDAHTIRPTPDDKSIYIFSIPPHHDVSIRLYFPDTYPAHDPPQTRGVESTGPHTRKGYGSQVLRLVDEVLRSVFVRGTVCLFEVVQELEGRLSTTPTSPDESDEFTTTTEPTTSHPTTAKKDGGPPSDFLPSWFMSSPLTEKKSTFLARATPIRHPDDVPRALAHLHATDKRTAKATHVMSAYRIRGAAAITYKDCEDDGEAAAGGRLLHLLQRMGVWDVLVVVSRWYGGVKLGNDRFRCINQVAREAVVGLGEGEGDVKGA